MRTTVAFWPIAALFLVAALPLCLLGYGSDNDTYGELDAGRLTWAQGVLSTSRHPGYWLHECLVHFLSVVGGSTLVNVCTAAISVLTLYRLWVLSFRFEIQWRLPIFLCIAWNPWYLIASTSCIDYVWALLFIVLSIESLLCGAFVRAGLLGGVAVAFRLGSIFPLAGAVAAQVLTTPSVAQVRRSALMLAMASLTGLLFYIPSWILFGRNLSFLHSHAGSPEMWTLRMYLGRAVYKPLYLAGIAVDALLLAIALLNRRRLPRRPNPMLAVCLGAVIGNYILFARYPMEISYLLPALPLLFLAFGYVISRSWQAWGLTIASISYCFVSISLASPNRPNGATSAKIGVQIAAGPLLNDIGERRSLIGCATLDCYAKTR